MNKESNVKRDWTLNTHSQTCHKDKGLMLTVNKKLNTPICHY